MNDPFADEERYRGDPYQRRPWLSWYPPGVPSDVSVPDVSVPSLLDAAADNYGDNVALEFLGRAVRYRELREEVNRCAAALREHGVVQGDRVAIVLPNCPQAMIVFYATLRIGAIAVACNPLYTSDELHHQLADSGSIIVVALDRTYETVRAALLGTAVREVVVTSLAEYLSPMRRRMLDLPVRRARELREKLVVPVPEDAEVTPFSRLLATDAPIPDQAALDPARDLAVLQYTGGTTGRPKGAMLTHRNLVANAHQVRTWDPRCVVGKEVTIAVLPLFHVYGLTLNVITTVLLAGTAVLLPTFDVDLTLRAIKRQRPTIMPGVPPIYRKLLDAPDVGRYDLRSIRTCISGAMRLPVATVEEFQNTTGGLVVEGYGMTESSPVTVVNPLSRNARAGTIGVPISSTYVRIVDESDPTRIVPIGEAGELAVHGPQVFAGYWNQPEETASVLRDEWLYTGDVGVMSPDGFITLIDRKRDVIIASGFSIYPSEIEDVLRMHPAVADAAVIGVPDRYRGETVKAYVEPFPGLSVSPDEVIAHCTEHLTPYKVPKLVEIRSDLPRSMLGKVLHRILRSENQAPPDEQDDPFAAYR